MSQWDPKKYLEFRQQRTQPAIDLARRIQSCKAGTVLDLGCGPGNSTQVLRQVFPQSHIVGVDYSPQMIQQAKENCPGCDFVLGNATQLQGSYDLIFSNACLQWVPDHRKLIPYLFEHLADGGVLAVQVPMNGKEPLLALMDRVVRQEAWPWLEEANPEPNETLLPQEYFDVLSSLTREFDMWETVYYHKMPSVESMVEWIKGTRLRPYLNALSPQWGDQLLDRITGEAKTLYTPQPNGEILFPFRRFFFTAVKAGL